MINNCRTCIVSKKKFNKNELIRFIVTKNKIIVDKEKTMRQRGYYIHNSHEVLSKAKNFSILRKKLNVINEKEILDELIKNIS